VCFKSVEYSQPDIPFVHAATSGLAGQFTVTIDDDDDLSVDTAHPHHMHHHRQVSVHVENNERG
jgi:hypothetical protein